MRLSPLDTIRALLALARLGVTTRLRFGGRYWIWRRETAFGKHENAIPLKARLHALLEFGAWVWRMRRMM